jgi:hypothetical protein
MNLNTIVEVKRPQKLPEGSSPHFGRLGIGKHLAGAKELELNFQTLMNYGWVARSIEVLCPMSCL